MKTYEDDIIASLTKAVRGIVEDVKYPHDMYKGDDVKTAKDPKEHKALADDGYTHEKPVDEVAEPRAKGEKEFKGKHKVKKSGEKEDGSVVKEAVRSHPKNNDSLSSGEYSKAKKNKNFSKDDWAWDNKVDLYKRVTNEDLDESADKKIVKKAKKLKPIKTIKGFK